MTARSRTAAAERITLAAAALITGVPARTLRHLAASGLIAGAAKLSRRWTFNEARLRAFIAERERCYRNPRRDAFGAAYPDKKSCGLDWKSTAKSTAGACGPGMQKLLQLAAKNVGNAR